MKYPEKGDKVSFSAKGGLDGNIYGEGYVEKEYSVRCFDVILSSPFKGWEAGSTVVVWLEEIYDVIPVDKHNVVLI